MRCDAIDLRCKKAVTATTATLLLYCTRNATHASSVGHTRLSFSSSSPHDIAFSLPRELNPSFTLPPSHLSCVRACVCQRPAQPQSSRAEIGFRLSAFVARVGARSGLGARGSGLGSCIINSTRIPTGPTVPHTPVSSSIYPPNHPNEPTPLTPPTPHTRTYTTRQGKGLGRVPRSGFSETETETETNIAISRTCYVPSPCGIWVPK